jgi:preprotein translocase subunit SecD
MPHNPSVLIRILLPIAVLALSACTSTTPEPTERTTLTLRAENPDAASLERTRVVLVKRAELNGLKATVTVNADSTITISAPGKTDLSTLAIVGALRFRKVLDIGDATKAPMSCADLAARPIEAIRKPEQVTLCQGNVMYLLGPSKVETADVVSAKAEPGLAAMVVTLGFTPSGQAKWAALTREAFGNEGSQCAQKALGGQGHCQIAIVLDQAIVSAPEILAADLNGASISGKFTDAQAKAMANVLQGGELPLVLTPAA